MSDEIKLTLMPEMNEPAAPDAATAVEPEQTAASAAQPAPAAEAATAQAVAEAVEEPAKPAVQEPVFTPEEQATIDAFSKQIDVKDSNLVFYYGAAAQKNISEFSDTALENVKTKELGTVGDEIAKLVVTLRGFDTDEEKPKGLFGLFKKKGQDIEEMKARFDTTEQNVDKIVSALEAHQVQLLKDIAMLDRLYDQNLRYFKELSMYIAAGKKRLNEFRENELAQATEKAKASGLPEDAQAAKDLSDKADRFEKKIYDLELTRNICIQMAPQIRMIQSSNQMMAEKIQTSIVNTIPLWKSQMVMALGLAHTQKAMEAQRSVTDLTNDLLKKNAEKLHMATVESAKEAERGIVDIETLKTTNQMLIDTMDEVINIQKDGREKRRAAEQELAQIEAELRQKVLDFNTGK